MEILRISFQHSHLFILIFLFSIQHVLSGPLSRSNRISREVYPEVVDQTNSEGSQTQVCIVGDVVYGTDENVPSEQPCLQCKCAPPDVQCHTTTCVQQPGCKAIHRPNKCCPDYQCECLHEGKPYANGERVPAVMGAECLVCYCRGGEVQCADVGCYTRNDCEPRKVPGQCCPKYDHCPPREPLSDRIQLITESSLNSLESESLQKDQPDTKTDSVEEGSGDISLSSEDFISSTSPKSTSTPATLSIKEVSLVNKSTQTEQEPERPKITIQEVIPSRTEYRITDKVNYVTPIEVPTSTIDSTNDLTDSQTYASEKTEVYNHPPPVLRIGDQLIYLKQGQLIPGKDRSTPSPVITIKGAEGLQIGLDSDELIDHDSVTDSGSSEEPTTQKLQEDTSVSTSTTSDNLSSSTMENFSKSHEFSPTDDLPEENPYYPSIPEDLAILGREEQDFSTLPSKLRDITKNPEITIPISEENSTSFEGGNYTVIDEDAERFDGFDSQTKQELVTLTTESFGLTDKIERQLKEISSSSTDPEYLSSTETPNTSSIEKILPEILELRNNKTLPQNSTGHHPEWLKSDATTEPTKVSTINAPLVNEKAALPESLLRSSVPSDFEDVSVGTLDEQTVTPTQSTTFEDTPISTTSKYDTEHPELMIEMTKFSEETSPEMTTNEAEPSGSSSNENASVLNESKQLETSELVEILPGFERSEMETPKDVEIKSDSPKKDVELIGVGENLPEKMIDQTIVKQKDEIQKRDVVKKVLKDTFENPKENIRTDIVDEQEHKEDNIDYLGHRFEESDDNNPNLASKQMEADRILSEKVQQRLAHMHKILDS